MVSSSSATEPNPSVRSNLRFTFSRTQQTNHTAQAFPCGLVQRRLRADNVANHVPRRHVQRPFRRHSHRERNRTLRTKTNPLRRGLLPRLYPHRLRDHIHRHRLVPSLNLPPAPQTRNNLHVPPFLISRRPLDSAAPLCLRNTFRDPMRCPQVCSKVQLSLYSSASA